MSQHISLQYALFPNISLTFDSRHIELWQILPDATDTSQVLHTTHLRQGLSDQERSKAVDMIPWICEKVVDGEDFWVANEPAPQHLHRGFAAALQAAAESRPPA